MTCTVRFLPILLTIIFTLAPLHLHFAHAAGSSGDQLASDIDHSLRSAEKSIFSGSFQEGAAIMNEVAVKLQELQASDPGNKKLVTISSKFNQLQRKVGYSSPPGRRDVSQIK